MSYNCAASSTSKYFTIDKKTRMTISKSSEAFEKKPES